MLMQALFFDCDGVLGDTERDGHRIAFNEAFRRAGLAVEWDVAEYGRWLAIAGGKERMRAYFGERGWPSAVMEQDDLIADLHAVKTAIFQDLVDAGRIAPRPGVRRLAEAAIAAGVKVAVCSTSAEASVRAMAKRAFGPELSGQIAIFAGDIVPKKKPDPAIYVLAARTLAVEPKRCVVIEDSHIGLKAASSAGMPCIVTVSHYTEGEDLAKAALVVPDLGPDDAPRVTLADCAALCG